jgi:hypothetical protein
MPEAMKIVHHRRNTTALLAETPHDYGVEVDIRSRGSELIIHHDPFVEGEPFEEWLQSYAHGLLILNVKEEGLEARLLALMADHGQSDFFFLDQSFPFLLRTVRQGEARCAVRVSEYETVDTALRLDGQARWIWLDSFTGALPPRADLERLAASAFEICLVSPELQGREPVDEIARLRDGLGEAGVTLDAVCTKRPDLWN